MSKPADIKDLIVIFIHRYISELTNVFFSSLFNSCNFAWLFAGPWNIGGISHSWQDLDKGRATSLTWFLTTSLSLPCLLTLPARLFAIKIIMKLAKGFFGDLHGACLSRALSPTQAFLLPSSVSDPGLSPLHSDYSLPLPITHWDVVSGKLHALEKVCAGFISNSYWVHQKTGGIPV